MNIGVITIEIVRVHFLVPDGVSFKMFEADYLVTHDPESSDDKPLTFSPMPGTEKECHCPESFKNSIMKFRQGSDGIPTRAN